MNLPFRPPARIVVEVDKLRAMTAMIDLSQSDIELALMMLAAGQTGQAFDVLVQGYARLAGVDAAAPLYLQVHRDGIALVGRAA